MLARLGDDPNPPNKQEETHQLVIVIPRQKLVVQVIITTIVTRMIAIDRNHSMEINAHMMAIDLVGRHRQVETIGVERPETNTDLLVTMIHTIAEIGVAHDLLSRVHSVAVTEIVAQAQEPVKPMKMATFKSLDVSRRWFPIFK